MVGTAPHPPEAGPPEAARAGVWVRAVVAVVLRPVLWPVAARQVWRLARPRWWRRFPFLPLPDASYLRFRLETAYGTGATASPGDVIAYLRWCRGRRS
jgi:hypothetical protein